MKMTLYYPLETLLRLKGLLSRSTLPATQVFQKIMCDCLKEFNSLGFHSEVVSHGVEAVCWH